MNFKNSYKILALLITMAMCTMSCSRDSEGEDPKLLVSETEVSFEPDGDTLELTIETNAKWKISNAASWLQLNKTSGDAGNVTVALTTVSNETGVTRSVILNVTSDNGQARRISVSQTANLYPSYNLTPKPADMTGMTHTATEVIAAIKFGINIGNTLELQGVNADPTEANIKFIKQMGFNAVRLPCAWDFVGSAKDSPTSQIDPAYMVKVKQVVQWCVENDLYVLVNIHWDGGWLESKEWMDKTPTNNYNPASSRKDEVNSKQKALWEQIATALRDFDEHLLFASANEPNAETAEEMKILLSYHKTFIDAVRSTGGRNTYRTLVLQGHTDHIDSTDFTKLNDPTPNRLAFEWHTYTPSSFTLLDNDKVNGGWDNVRFYWSEANHSTIEPGRNCEYGEEAESLVGFNQIKTKFIDKGIPCIMGEYSAQRWTATRNKFIPQEMDKHNKSVDDWYTFNTKECKAIGGAPFVWDTGGLFDRGNNTVKDQRSLDAVFAVSN